MQGIEAILQGDRSVHLAGQAVTGKTTVAKVRSLQPDAVLMDIEFEDSSGMEIVRRIRRFDSSVLILIITLSDEVDQIANCIEAGASGYVSSDVSSSALLSTIRKQVKVNGPASIALMR